MSERMGHRTGTTALSSSIAAARSWPGAWIGGADGLGAGSLLRLALVIGAAGGLAEALYLTARQAIKQQPAAWYNADVVWMAPLATASTLLVIAALLLPVAWLMRTRWGVLQATFLFTFPVVFGLLHAPGFAFHPWSRLLLALGAAVVIARGAAHYPALSVRSIRRATLPVAALLVLLAAYGITGLPGVAESRALARLPAARAGAPNVLLIILDTVRAANLSLYGYERTTTPHIDRWARSGVTFERALSTAPWTLPSHASMFTGHYNFVAGTGVSRPLGRDHPTLAEVLAAHGYETAAFVANLGYTTRASGLHRGFARYEDFPVEAGMFVRSAWLPARVSLQLSRIRAFPRWPIPKDAARINRDFLRWLERPRQRPFFVFLNYYDAHSPYRAPAPYRSRFGPPSGEEEEFEHGRRYTTEELRPWINAYDGSIAFIDAQLAEVFAALEDHSLRENTLVIISSDHGEMFGERGQIEHTSGLYMPAVHVPLAMALPASIPAGVRVTAPVSLRDLPATVLDLLGLGAASPIPGQSLAAQWQTTPAMNMASAVVTELDRHNLAAPWTPIYRGDMKALLADRLYYIRNGDGVEEVYDAFADPGAVNDRIDDAGVRPAVERLRAALDSILHR